MLANFCCTIGVINTFNHLYYYVHTGNNCCGCGFLHKGNQYSRYHCYQRTEVWNEVKYPAIIANTSHIGTPTIAKPIAVNIITTVIENILPFSHFFKLSPSLFNTSSPLSYPFLGINATIPCLYLHQEHLPVPALLQPSLLLFVHYICDSITCRE